MNHFDDEYHHRRSIRLKGYNYTLAGAYFVTICTQNRACLFGEILDAVMNLNEAGRMVQAVWDAIPDKYPGVDIDQFIIMPNHIHGIIVLTDDPVIASNRNAIIVLNDDSTIVGAGPRACPPPVRPPDVLQPPAQGQGMGQPRDAGQPQGVAPTETVEPWVMSLADVVHRFKTLTTKKYTDGVKQYGWSTYQGRVWQRNYYEHIVRDEDSLSRIRQYISDNPAAWGDDDENPHRQEKS